MATPTRRKTVCADCSRPAPKGMCADCRAERQRLYALRRAEGHGPLGVSLEIQSALDARVAALQGRMAAGLPLFEKPRPRGPYSLVETRTA